MFPEIRVSQRTFDLGSPSAPKVETVPDIVRVMDLQQEQLASKPILILCFKRALAARRFGNPRSALGRPGLLNRRALVLPQECDFG